MNAIQQDKCFARRIIRAGNVRAIGIVRVTQGIENARQIPNDERRSAWGARYYASGQHRRVSGGTYQR